MTKRALILVLLIALTPASLGLSKVVEKIAIIVNNRAATLLDLKKIYDARSSALFQKYTGAELQKQIATLKKQVIEEKFEELLLLEKAKQEDISITDEQIEGFIQQLLKENNFKTEAQLENALMQSTGMTLKEFKENQKTQNTARTVINQLVVRKIQVDDAEMQAYYAQHQSEYESPFTYSLQEIVMFYNDQNRASVLAKMEECRKLIMTNKLGFGEAVQKYSEAGSKDYNGEMQNLKKGDLNKKLEKAALSLKLEEVSPVIDIPGSFHIVRLTEVNKPKARPFKDVKDDIRSKIREPQIDAAIKKFIAELKGTFYTRVDVKPEDL
jgi:peptidyl-prolyl cis-trans isomerase SurA